MIFEVQSYALIVSDVLYSLSAGFVVGFIYQLLSVFLYGNKTAVFVKDIIASSVFAVVIYSFSISFSNYHILRRYNVLPAVLGAVAFVPCFSKIGQVALSIVKTTIIYFTNKLVAITVEKFHKSSLKKQYFTKKSKDKVLKNDTLVLYN